MASTYSSNLKIELIATGEQSGTWGTTTNNNFANVFEQSIVGRVTVNFATDANVTLSASDSVSTQDFRNLYLNLTSSGSLTATRDLIVPTINKTYVVQNNTTGSQSIRVKTSAGTGITVPNGRTAALYVDGTNVIVAWDWVDINGGTIDGTVIGGSSAAAGTFTTINGTVLTATGDSSFTSTGALLISKGTTAQQPGSPATGMMRYNTTTNQFEGYSGSSPAWKSIGGSALSNDTSTSSNLYPVFAAATSGTAENLYTSNAKYLYKPSTGDLQAQQFIAENGIVVNKQTVATSYTIGAGYSASSAGPVTVASGVSVTVASGSRWVVL